MNTLSTDISPTIHRQFTHDEPTDNRHSTRARDNRIKDKDTKSFSRARDVYDGIDAPYLLEELLARYSVEFARTPVNERCVFCNAVYLGEAKILLKVDGYAVSNHVWLVDFLRANNVDYSKPLPGLLTIGCKKWRNEGLGDPRTTFSGISAVKTDRGRDILAIECKLEERL